MGQPYPLARCGVGRGGSLDHEPPVRCEELGDAAQKAHGIAADPDVAVEQECSLPPAG